MTLWCEDFSGCSLEDVFQSQTENREWNKELRLKSKALVDSRLAKQMTMEEYVAHRKLANEAAAECKRRGLLLANEIISRRARPLVTIPSR